MLNFDEVMADLKSRGTAKTRQTYMRHGYPRERTLGVSVADLKLVAKTIRKRQELAYELYETRILETMYLAGMVADGSQMDRRLLQQWADCAEGMPMIFEYTVPWVAVEHAAGSELASVWIESDLEHVASAGWCTMSGFATIRPDASLDLQRMRQLLNSIPERIADSPNRVRCTMNGFVIAVGTYVRPLAPDAKLCADRIDVVSVDQGDTACTILLASERIAKAESAGRVGLKRKTIRC
jgi:hypothetical protein